MIIDGNAIADDLRGDIRRALEGAPASPRLTALVMGGNFVSKKFIAMKRKFGDSVGVETNVIELPENITTELFINRVEKAAAESDGILIQLPLSGHLDTDRIVSAIPVSHDVDVLSDGAMQKMTDGALPVLPPVVGAIKEILGRHDIEIKEKRVVVVGEGRLVGRPAALWFAQQGANVEVVNRESYDISYEIKKADILVLGAGVPGLIKPDMAKERVVILDAGTSALSAPGRPREESGKLAGDAEPACRDTASLFTPVPGGIGPIAIAMIFKNLLILQKQDI